jgi:hypothetical protein
LAIDMTAPNRFTGEAAEFRPWAAHSDDRIALRFAYVDPEKTLISIRELCSNAHRMARELDPDGRLELIFDRFTSTFHAGAGRDGERVEPGVARLYGALPPALRRRRGGDGRRSASRRHARPTGPALSPHRSHPDVIESERRARRPSRKAAPMASTFTTCWTRRRRAVSIRAAG